MNNHFYKTLLTYIFFISLNTSVKAQPTSVGDIVFTGFQTSGAATITDQFAFVPLVILPVGTIIKFTDNAWNSASQTFNTNESNITFTVTPTAIPAGRELRIILGPPAVARFTDGSGAGTVVVTGPVSMPTTGEQMFAYLGPDLAPTVFLSGIHMNVQTGGCGGTTSVGWDPAACVFPGSPSNNTSMKPATLTTGTDAFWSFVEHHNGRFTGCGLSLLTPAAVRAAVNNPANWFFEDPLGAEASWAPNGPFAGCAFLGLFPLPVKLISFTGKLNADKTATLQWKVAEQQNIQEYIVEESTDGTVYTQLGAVAAGNGTDQIYSFIDRNLTVKNFYRLKIVELTGKVSVSNTVHISLTSSSQLDIYPNPVTDKLTIRQSAGLIVKTAWLYDVHGKLLQQVQINNQHQPVNMGGLPAGIYYLKMDDGTAFKVFKK